MRAGLAVSIPLTLLQCYVTQHTHVPLDALAVASNVALCDAVYSADRLDGAGPAVVARTRLSALASSTYYLAEPSTVALVPLILLLHTSYAALKPWVAPAKPFFVALLWTAAVYAAPTLHAGLSLEQAPLDPSYLAFLFLSISSLSHAADVVDIEDDRAAGVLTPAVLLGSDSASAYGMGLAFASAFLHAHSAHPDAVYDVLGLTATASICLWRSDMALRTAAAVAACVVVAAHADAHAAELLRGVLHATTPVHEQAISSATRLAGVATRLDEPYRGMLADVVFGAARAGDACGAALLHLYEAAVRRGG